MIDIPSFEEEFASEHNALEEKIKKIQGSIIIEQKIMNWIKS